MMAAPHWEAVRSPIQAEKKNAQRASRTQRDVRFIVMLLFGLVGLLPCRPRLSQPNGVSCVPLGTRRAVCLVKGGVGRPPRWGHRAAMSSLAAERRRS